MGTVYAEITLKNAGDLVRVRERLIKDQDVREVRVNAMVDTGAYTLFIGEALCEELGLLIQETDEITLANNTKEICKIAEPVEIQWKQRRSVLRPWVLPGIDEVLLGSIPLEDMDLMIDPGNEELTGRHGDKVVGRAVGVRRSNSSQPPK